MGAKSYFFFGSSRGSEKKPTVHDVYFDGKEEHGLPDDPVTGKPMVFGSKAEKAAYLKANGLVEAGDKINGAPPNIISQQARYESENAESNARKDRDMALRSLAEVRKMGKDVRRQEFLRIQKGGR